MGAERQRDLNPGEILRDFVGAFVDELARGGVRHACICPGSRSAPLALLLRRHPAIRLWTHLDERSAAFFALGIAKALAVPVAIVSTSGTAAINFAPAVAEAYYGRVPLLVLTADRPPELREVGANQTIDQIRLYGSHVKWSVDAALPESGEEAVRYVRSLACRAVAIARSDPPGPAHVNFPLREPLQPATGTAPMGREGNGQPPYIGVRQAARRPDPADLADLAPQLRNAPRGLIVCGPRDDPDDLPEAVMLLARELGYPVLADPLSQVRCGPHHDHLVIDAYDAVLRDEEAAGELAPVVVLRFGAAPTSKPLLHYLKQHARARQVLVDETGWNDPELVVSDIIHSDPSSFCRSLLAALPPAKGRQTNDEWASRWREVNEQARSALEARLSVDPGVSEPGVLAELAGLLPPGATLFAGNSMPVRDLDAFFPGGSRPFRFLANRGVSGIDGVVSTALGVAAVSSGPIVLVIGDLSFYHDLNGLLAARRFAQMGGRPGTGTGVGLPGLRATIVLLNNDGGGIFSLLPQAEDAEHFEELFGTPHGLDFRHAAEMYGLGYRLVELREEFRTAMQESIASDGVTVLEIRTDRQANAQLHRELWQAVQQAVRQPARSGRSS